MKAHRAVPWLAALSLWVASCLPSSTRTGEPGATKPAAPQKLAAAKQAPPAPAKAKPAPKPTPPRKPKAKAPQKPKAPAPAKPQKQVAKPQKPPQPKPPKLFVFSPQRRNCFVPGETAQVTAVVYAPQALPGARLALRVSGVANLAWTATDDLGTLPAGRHSFTYGLSVEHFAPGDYVLEVSLEGAKTATWRFTVGQAVSRTHFPIAAWLREAPATLVEARRLSGALGFNVALVSRRSAWRTRGVNVVASVFLARLSHLRSHPQAPPLEQKLDVPAFVRTGDLLSGAGLRWVSACAVSGGSFPHFLPSRDYTEPRVVGVGLQRLAHRIAAERRFRNCIGIHFTDEAGLAPWSQGASSGPFGTPWRLEAFKRAAGLKNVAWKKGAKDWETWRRFLRFRIGLVSGCLKTWTGAAKAARSRAGRSSWLASVA